MKLINCHIVIAVLAIILLPKVICADDYMNWSSPTFGPISLSNISHRADISEGNSIITLITSGNAQITADTSTNAQLHRITAPHDTLVTEYKLEFAAGDNGIDNTGPTTQAVANSSSDTYKPYNEFLTTSLAITYVLPDDNDVQVTLHVKASNLAGNLADSGDYEATQILTVTWGSP